MILTLSLLAIAAEPYDPSHAALRGVLDGAVTGTGVRYEIVASRRAKLDAYLATVAAPPVPLDESSWVAFGINAYNAYTLDLVLDNWPLTSILGLDSGKVWDTRTFVVGGETMTLNQLETALRQHGGARVHAALNCASKGCPPLAPEPFTADRLSAQLDEANRRWARTTAFRVDQGVVALSMIFDWYDADFASYDCAIPKKESEDARHALCFLSQYVDSQVAQGFLTQKTRWQDYDWDLNAAR